MASTSDQKAPEVREMTLSRLALKALGELPDLVAGPLSPLARVRAPQETADKATLMDSLSGLEGEWRTAIPALVDPSLTALLILAGPETSVVAQFLWLDATGSAPGFRMQTRSADLNLTGPFTADGVRERFLKALSLETVTPNTSVRMTLPAEQFFVLVTLIDAYLSAAATRRAARVAGPPPGLLSRELADAWRSGLSKIDPAWSVSLFSILNPEATLPDFEKRIPQVMREMAATGLLAVLFSETGEPADDIYVPGPEIDRLCRSLGSSGKNFGVAVQRRLSANRVAATILGGWRTGAGIWLADISALPGGDVELMVMDPQAFTGLIEEIFTAPDATAQAAPGSRGSGIEAILAGLKRVVSGQTGGAATASSHPVEAAMKPELAKDAAPASDAAPPMEAAPSTVAASSPNSCLQCGTTLKAGAMFCGNCGKTVQQNGPPAAGGSPQGTVCAYCGTGVKAGAAYCGNCGAKANVS